MDFFEVVNRRGSYRDKFEQKAVPDKDIRKIPVSYTHLDVYKRQSMLY